MREGEQPSRSMEPARKEPSGRLRLGREWHFWGLSLLGEGMPAWESCSAPGTGQTAIELRLLGPRGGLARGVGGFQVKPLCACVCMCVCVCACACVRVCCICPCVLGFCWERAPQRPHGLKATGLTSTVRRENSEQAK